MRKFQAVDVRAHVAHIGARVRECWRTSAAAHKLPVTVEDGFPCLAHFRFEHDEADALRTLYTQEMLARGFLAGTAIYPTLAHNDAIVARYGEAIEAVFGELAAASGGRWRTRGCGGCYDGRHGQHGLNGQYEPARRPAVQSNAMIA